MSKLNIHVKRTVHFAHGYRNGGRREVEDKKNFSSVSSFLMKKKLQLKSVMKEKSGNKIGLQLQYKLQSNLRS